jgi:hypothetical protein
VKIAVFAPTPSLGERAHAVLQVVKERVHRTSSENRVLDGEERASTARRRTPMPSAF